MSGVHASDDAAEAPSVRFDDLELLEKVRAGIRAAGFTHCTPIQARVLPLALQGRDVAGQAQTGTGKTAAFLISLFTRLLESGRERRPGAPRALVIAPTRELVVQIAKDAETLGAGNGLVVQAVYGGVDYRKQREQLRQDVDLLVGTPGRLIDYWKQRVYHLDSIEVLVIDEADRMFDMGFIKDLRFLLRRCPPAEKRQSMLFSATLSHDVMELAYIFLNDAVRVEVKPEQVTAEGVEHVVYHVGIEEKIPALLGLLEREGAERTLLFCNMKRTADRICRTLAANGYLAEQITGDIDQRKRLRILEEFRDGSLPLLVATDVASRGLHIEGVTHVINFDLPFDPEDYVHRVGRTARAGAQGKAISLACEDYVEGLELIEKLVGFKLPHEFPDDGLLREYKRPAPRRRTETQRGGRPGRSSRDEPVRGRSRSAAHAAPAAPAAEGTPSSEEPRRRRRRRRSGEARTQEGGDAASAPVEAAPREGAAAGEGAPAKRRRRRKRRKPSGEGSGGEAPAAGGAQKILAEG
jgi:ATP-dependent RNA helicase RhlB